MDTAAECTSTREIGGQVAHGVVDVVRGERSGPVGVVPPVRPYRPAGVCGHVLPDQSSAVLGAGGFTEVQAGDPQSCSGEVHMAVDERRGNEGTVEVVLGGIGNCSRPTPSLPNQATVAPRTAIAVASGCDGLWIRPLNSSVVTALVLQHPRLFR